MSNGIYVATSGAIAQEQALDVTANNIANASTAGYKAARPTFAAVLAGAKDAVFARVGATGADLTPGPTHETGGALDVAVDGEGWFAVETPRGLRYTRDGAFVLDAEGRLSTADGALVQDQDGGAIEVPTDAADVSIDVDGTVLADGAAVGTVGTFRFAPGALSREGANLFQAAPGATPLAGDPPSVTTGALEDANFNVVRGMIDLVQISRTYEALHRVIETYKDIDQRTAREIGGPK